MKTLDLIGLGECMVELYADGPLGLAKTLNKAYAGDVLNALVMASRLGSQTGFISRVGNDPFGPGMLEFWQSEGVDTAQAPVVKGENGVYFISLLEGGEREFTYRRAGSAAAQIHPQDLDSDYIADAQLLLLSGITQAISQSAQAATLEAAKIAKERGVRVAFDPNYRPRLWAAGGGLEAAQAAFAELLPYVDILLPSVPTDMALMGYQGLEPEPLLKRLSQQVPLVAMKAAHLGAYVAHDGHSQHSPTQTMLMVDSTGAGDAWNGAFLHFILSKRSTISAAHLANRVAGWKLGFRGAIPPKAPASIFEL